MRGYQIQIFFPNRNLRNLGQDHENPEKVSIASADKTIGINGVILTQESEVLEITDIRLGNQKKGGDVKMANTFP